MSTNCEALLQTQSFWGLEQFVLSFDAASSKYDSIYNPLIYIREVTLV